MINTFIWLALGTGALLYGFSLYKGLQALRHDVAKAWQDIDTLLQQRHEEAPVLVTACRPFPKFERALLEKLLDARRSAEDARRAHDLTGLGEAGQRLRRDLARIAGTVEACPELKAHPSLRQLLTRLTGLENALADRRELYNRCVQRHNQRRTQFPEVLLARVAGFAPAEPLDAPADGAGRAKHEALARA